MDENNPYPVANYALHGNIWLPVSEDNPMPTQLYGSNVEEVIVADAVASADVERTVELKFKHPTQGAFLMR